MFFCESKYSIRSIFIPSIISSILLQSEGFLMIFPKRKSLDRPISSQSVFICCICLPSSLQQAFFDWLHYTKSHIKIQAIALCFISLQLTNLRAAYRTSFVHRCNQITKLKANKFQKHIMQGGRGFINLSLRSAIF